MKLLGEKQASLVYAVNSWKLKNEDENKYIVEKTRNGSHTLKIKNSSGNYIYLHSRYNPQKEAENLLKEKGFENTELVIILGLGLGHHLGELVNKKKDYSHVVVVEQDMHIFKLFLTYFDCSRISMKSVTFVVGYNIPEVVEKMSPYYTSISAGKFKFFHLKPSYNLCKDFYSTFIAEIDKNLLVYVQDLTTRIYAAATIAENVCDNMDYIFTNPTINNLFEKFKAKPGILIAAGPSLTPNIPLLKQIKNRVIMVAVDTALKTLLAHGLKPDIVLSFDYSHINYEKFEDVDTEGYFLVGVPTIKRKLCNRYKEKLFITYLLNDPIMEWLKTIYSDKGTISSGGSVAHAAFSLLCQFGCDPIILVGLDLAFPGGNIYAKNSMYGNQKIDEQGDNLLAVERIDGKTIYGKRTLVDVKSVDGTMVKTDQSYLTFITNFEKIFIVIDKKIIDTTLGGALKKHTIVQSLDSAMKQYCQERINVKAILDKAYIYPEERNVDEVLNKFHSLKIEIESTSIYAKEGAVECHRILKKVKKRKIVTSKNFEIIMKNYEAIEKNTKSNPLIAALTSRELYNYDLNRSLFDDDEDVKRDTLVSDIKNFSNLFNGLADSAKTAIELIELAIKRLESLQLSNVNSP